MNAIPKTVGWFTSFPYELEMEKRVLSKWWGRTIEAWYVDTEPTEEYPEFHHLIEDIKRGDIGVVVHRGLEYLPSDRELLDAFYEAARENDTSVMAVEPSRPQALEVLSAKLLLLLHEWDNNETADMAARGHHTIQADAEDVAELREHLKQQGTSMSERWLKILEDSVPEGTADDPAAVSDGARNVADKYNAHLSYRGNVLVFDRDGSNGELRAGTTSLYPLREDGSFVVRITGARMTYEHAQQLLDEHHSKF